MHFGSVMAPFTAFLVCRGLKTLGVRMKQYNESALKIAKWLEANPKIETVRYPFLESNPQYAIAKKQMKGGGGMILSLIHILHTAGSPIPLWIIWNRNWRRWNTAREMCIRDRCCRAWQRCCR